MLARLALLLLLLCPWDAHAQAGKVPPVPPSPAPGQPPPAPPAEPTNPVLPWTLAFMLPIAVLVVVCMPSRKG